MRLSELTTGQRAVIRGVTGSDLFRKRILEMGFVRGKEIMVVRSAPLRDPIYYKILDYNVSLRRQDAARIDVELLVDGQSAPESYSTQEQESQDGPMPMAELPQSDKSSTPSGKTIKVALVGNPNCGKTSLFNLASGAHEHVGNYSGVTVQAKEGYFSHDGYRIEIVDLPGSYSLSPFSPEELYIRQYLTAPATRPDIVLNIVDTTNLERNLYLTVQVKEMGLPVVMALNMYDEFEQTGDVFDIEKLSRLLGIPMEPTVCRTGVGLHKLFDRLVSTYLGQERYERRLLVNYGSVLEPLINDLVEKIDEHLTELPSILPRRYVAVKLLEGDSEMEQYLRRTCRKADFILAARRFAVDKASSMLHGERTDTVITDQRYGYIVGALRETYRKAQNKPLSKSEKIDHWLVHRFWGFPFFFLFMFIMFEATFDLGKYPQDWIDAGVSWLGSLVGGLLPDGSFRDLIIDGVIGGVGGVIVFLPNILILYLFISLMEDTGYMSRAAFIMDKLMHRMGLHGKSFIPLVMGFGCNVPAIMATRTIESKKSRMITMLVLPLMSCSARLPVYLLLAGVFFPSRAGLVLFSLYLLGILLAVGVARILKATAFRGEDVPFVMELPPYRIPTPRSVLVHMWERSKQYLRKMGTVILLASIAVWFLGYFPRNNYGDVETQRRIAGVARNLEAEYSGPIESKPSDEYFRTHADHIVQQENSFIGCIGRATEPILRPLGFDWKMGVALITGAAAKEIVVSTLGVIYTGDAAESPDAEVTLSQRIRLDRRADGSPSFTPLIAFALMVFVLIYFPCIATVVAIGRESGHWYWALFSAVYSCLLAWAMAFVVYRGGLLLGLG